MARFLTVEEIAEELVVPKKWVLERIREGALASHKMGHRTIRVRREDLDEFITRSYIPAAVSA